MKIVIAMLVFVPATFLVQAQNLVPNPSFEDTIACPFGLAQMSRAMSWSSYGVTPDYFNSCAPEGNSASVPLNLVGYQNARTGNAYAGLVTFVALIPNRREYIGAQLTQPLDSAQKYYITFYVSRGLNSSQHFNIATNKIGIRFSTTGYSQSFPVPVDNYSHLYSDSVIADTIGWKKVSGTFIADSAYQYLAIGNFFNDSSTTVMIFDTTAVEAYYYIDDVCVSTDSLVCNGIHEIVLEQNNNPLIQVFPNPAKDWIVLEGKGITSIEVMNVLGNNLGFYPTTASVLKNRLNLSSLSKGIYFLKINMIDGYYAIKKIILQN